MSTIPTLLKELEKTLGPPVAVTASREPPEEAGAPLHRGDGAVNLDA
jgi:hypothetical protein